MKQKLARILKQFSARVVFLNVMMMLYFVETSKIHPFKELYVMSSETDVLDNLIYYCRLLCNKFY